MIEKLFIPKYDTFNKDEYPVRDDERHVYYVRTPVLVRRTKEQPQHLWYAADVIEGGYCIEGFTPTTSKEQATLWAEVHNNFVGFSDDYVNDCLNWSINNFTLKPSYE